MYNGKPCPRVVPSSARPELPRQIGSGTASSDQRRRGTLRYHHPESDVTPDRDDAGEQARHLHLVTPIKEPTLTLEMVVEFVSHELAMRKTHPLWSLYDSWPIYNLVLTRDYNGDHNGLPNLDRLREFTERFATGLLYELLRPHGISHTCFMNALSQLPGGQPHTGNFRLDPLPPAVRDRWIQMIENTLQQKTLL